MSFVGKILVVVQLVLSVLFMALAGAVFAVHTNWKTKYDAQGVLLVAAQKATTDAQQETASVKTKAQKDVSAAEMLVAALQAQTLGQTNQIEALIKTNNEDQQKIETGTALVEVKSEEAEARNAEAQEQRIANRTSQASVDDLAVRLRKKDDEHFSLQLEHNNLNDKYKDGLIKIKELEDQIRKGGRPGENRNRPAGDSIEPPPPVDGLVKDVKMDRTNRPKYVEITIGSDDGLKTGHLMDVFRSGASGKDSQYLGKIRITSVEPDSAVGEVVESAKVGIIEEGDNVTTKL